MDNELNRNWMIPSSNRQQTSSLIATQAIDKLKCLIGIKMSMTTLKSWKKRLWTSKYTGTSIFKIEPEIRVSPYQTDNKQAF